MVGVLLLITWVFSAGYAALHGFLDNLGPLPPKTWHSGLPLLAVYAIIAAGPDGGRTLAVRSRVARCRPRGCRTTRWH